MADDHGIVREIAWKEIFPWLSLARALRLAIQVRLMVLASIAVLVTMLGWALLASIFSGSDNTSDKILVASYRTTPWTSQVASEIRLAPDGSMVSPAHVEVPTPGPFIAGVNLERQNALALTWTWLSAPFVQIFNRDLTMTGLALVLLCALWALAVWSLVGGAITRTVAVQLAREENIGLGAALRFAAKRFRHYFTAPLFPLLGVLLFVLPMALVGLLLRWEGFGAGVVGVIWPFYIVAGLVMTIFVTGLFFGWPLLFTMISTEGGDSFGAMSHAYSYVFQRPLYYLFLVIVAVLLGVLGATAVFAFAEVVIYLAAWGASWGGGPAVLNGSETFNGSFGAQAIGFWNGCVRLVPLGFSASYFWTAWTAIYFLLRLSTDGNETDEVYLDDQNEAFAMPPLKTDAHGVPMAGDGQEANDRHDAPTTRDSVAEQPE